jgi:hypothetical protein
MKILKPGSLRNNTLKHTCERCGCEFEFQERGRKVYWDSSVGYHLCILCPQDRCNKNCDVKTDSFYFD